MTPQFRVYITNLLLIFLAGCAYNIYTTYDECGVMIPSLIIDTSLRMSIDFIYNPINRIIDTVSVLLVLSRILHISNILIVVGYLLRTLYWLCLSRILSNRYGILILALLNTGTWFMVSRLVEYLS